MTVSSLLTSIGEQAFYGFNSLVSVVLEGSVAPALRSHAFEDIATAVAVKYRSSPRAYLSRLSQLAFIGKQVGLPFSELLAQASTEIRTSTSFS